MTVGDRIRKTREREGLSQVELAQKAGIKKQTLNKYEKNTVTNIPSDKIELLSKILKISPCYLMGWDEKFSNESNENVNSEDKRLNEIIDCYNNMADEGKTLLANQAKFYLDQYHKSKINERAM